MFSTQKPLEPKIYDAVIIGAGLAGLPAAVEAAKNGQEVLLVEIRSKEDFALRPQPISLDEEIKKYLESLCEKDNKEDGRFRLMLGWNTHHSIKDIQYFLIHKIGSSCKILFDSEVSQINLDEGYLFISRVGNPLQQQKIEFKDLVLANGGNHDTAKLLGNLIKYQPIQNRPEVHNLAGYFTVQSKEEKSAVFSKFPPMQTPLELIVDGEYCGYIYYKDLSAKKIKVSIVMHVSPEMAEKYRQDRSSGINYLKRCVETVFDKEKFSVEMTVSRKPDPTGPKKDALKCLPFSLRFMEAEKPVFIHKGHIVILAGQERRDSDFYQGHGGNDAIEDGRQAGLLIARKITVDDYYFDAKERSRTANLNTKLMQPVRCGGLNRHYLLPEIRLPSNASADDQFTAIMRWFSATNHLPNPLFGWMLLFAGHRVTLYDNISYRDRFFSATFTDMLKDRAQPSLEAQIATSNPLDGTKHSTVAQHYGPHFRRTGT